MKTKAILAALALVITPSLAAAMCGGHVKTSSQCGEGQMWDETTQACVTPVQS